MCGIYLIKCIVNEKCYIGASTDIYKRWCSHRNSYNKSKCYNYPLYVDIRRFGIDNFEFSVIEECEKECLEDKERFYIKKYNSYYNGYNQNMGGENCSNKPKEVIIGIIDDLKNSNMKQSDIANKWKVSTEMVQGINTGRHWKHDIEYPIRKKINKEYVCKKCGKTISKGSFYCVECYRESIKRKLNESDIDLIKSLIYKYKAISPVAKYLNVSDNCVRKFCKKHNIPYKAKDLKLINKNSC